ncbi:restriction endonuclease subunit S [Komagataeibacter europaeus]|uniref:restriction endonuclease subunit S n=1 Tax=Komagataeibacter europaeus TaxID=33995 RepID=UPI000237E2A7|nr:restriction endonuclease subunit S [Komagataeibacter europaeus]
MLPTGWGEATINDLGVYLNGMAFKPSDWEDQGTGIIRIQNLTNPKKPLNRTRRNFDEKYLVRRGDILVSWSATLDVFFWDREDAVLNQHIFKAIPSSVVDKRFLFIALKKAIYEMMKSEHLHGSTMKHINRGPFLAHKVWLPPLAEQRRIVAKLDSLTARIARARAELEHGLVLTQKMRQSVLACVFSGVLSETATQITKTSSHPAHWNMIPLGKLGEIQGGIQVGKKRPPESVLLEMPYIRVANVQRGWLNLSEIKTLKATESEIKRLILKDGDILMNEGGDRDKLGRGWVWKGQIPNCIHQNHVFRIRLANPEFPPEFISHYANEFGQTYFVDQGTQTTNLASISKRKVAALPVPIPPTDEARRIVQIINTTFTHADRLETETQRALTLLDRLESSLLAKAFRGELVPQDPNDEPASVLLDRIRAERAASTKPKRRRKQSTQDMSLPRKLQTEKHG